MKRVATALVLIPVTVWVALFAPEWAFKAVLALVGLIAFHEFDQIVGASGIPRPGWIGMLAGLGLLLAPSPDLIVVAIAIAGMLLALRAADLKDALPAAAVFILGVVYIFGAWRCAIGLRAIDPNWLMFALLLSWVGDTAAMYVGKAFGRHGMAPRVSPGRRGRGRRGRLWGE